jgi:putative phosphoserine phosphatase / 1-acylglycerol-3-phosphate O-acyltransferase
MTAMATATAARPTTGEAAIFDLDRTLIHGSSGTVFQRHLRKAGIGPDLGLLEMAGFYRLYQTFGESRATMQLVRLAARTSRGWPVTTVTEAAEGAAAELAEAVLPYARLLIDEHRDAGRRLVLASTSPTVLVGRLAERLGFDDYVATRWDDDGEHFTGRIDGPFVWGRAKKLAVQDWAAANDIDLSRSYAYSDSYYDSVLLASVGHPVAVNPDLRLTSVAMLRGWPIRHMDVGPGVVKIAGRELQDWLRPLNRPELIGNARFEFAGVENVPRTGPAILVFNHRSYFDSAAVTLLMARSGRNARFLGKKEVFDAPLIGTMTRAFGGIRVDRGTGSDEPLESAIQALRAGELVSLAPEGTIPRGPAFFEPELKGRWGAARLAAATHAPVIPVGLWGTEKVWPRSERLPRMASAERPLITVTVGEPVELKYRSADRDTVRIMEAISALLPAEARERRTPSEAELAMTYPPGYRGDPDQEGSRRPGSDT